jgi:pyruvate/2-oxoglutarate dehydrogenase complex dihydrolipoamide acyltransferase (E2) component
MTASNSPWRILTTIIYKKPRDSKIFGSVEFDVTEVEAFVAEQRKNGLKITLTHIFLLAFARGVAEAAPEINSYVRRGRIIQRQSVGVSLSVLVGDQMTAVKVENAERLSLQELSEYLQAEIQQLRKNNTGAGKGAGNLITKVPWPFRQWIFDFIRWLSIDWGVSMPFLGVSPNSFGSFVLTNIGSVGLDVGYTALAPYSNVAMVLSLGKVSWKPAVLDGQVVPRRMMTVSAALDHRVVDAVQAGRLFRWVVGALGRVEATFNWPGN